MWYCQILSYRDKHCGGNKMTRTKGSLNKQPLNHPDFLDMPTEERLEFVANLIIDQMLVLQHSDAQLLRELGLENYVERTTS
jgi:hypothetical protein